MEENLRTLEQLSNFKGGNDCDIPIEEAAIDNVRFIVKECAAHNLPQPKICPHAGGVGINIEWRVSEKYQLVFAFWGYDREIEMLYNPHDPKRLISLDAINCYFKNAYNAFNIIKLLLTIICK